MNCKQAQAMLAMYRELKSSAVDTTGLDVHLERCSSCRQVLACSSLVGEQIRSLPTIEPPPSLHEKLMQALAAEHARFLQQTSSAQLSPPTPEFLKPYLHQYTQQSHTTDALAAFSTADTGPLPILHPQLKRRISRRNQLAVFGLAAMLLLALLMSGLTSLLLLAHGDPKSVSTSLLSPSEITKITYTTLTPYHVVTSAVADRKNIYYAAHEDGSMSDWMLERLDRTTLQSVPLFPVASASPLVVLGVAHGWLVWLQLDTPTLASHNPHTASTTLTQPWSLHYLSLSSPSAQPHTLLSGKFNLSKAPSSVTTPVQGIWFVQDNLLVASIDNQGISHLSNYLLKSGSTFSSVIATASSGHVFTSPTANSDGSILYWAEEWFADGATLNSNIWIQQEEPAAMSSGHGAIPTVITKRLFRSDGTSFRPQVVDNRLFFLSTADPKTLGAAGGTTSTPTVTPKATPLPALSVVPSIDPATYAAPLDEGVSGTLLVLPTDGSMVLPTQISTTPASAVQSGTDFLLWQDGAASPYQMYDVATERFVTIGTALDHEHMRFLAVSGDTTAWALTTQAAAAITNANSTNAGTRITNIATLLAFDWPTKLGPAQ